jgi:hypothetical protein
MYPRFPLMFFVVFFPKSPRIREDRATQGVNPPKRKFRLMSWLQLISVNHDKYALTRRLETKFVYLYKKHP